LQGTDINGLGKRRTAFYLKMNIRVAAQEKMANTEVRDKDWA